MTLWGQLGGHVRSVRAGPRSPEVEAARRRTNGGRWHGLALDPCTRPRPRLV
jgi:hypothetical protein